ncbi:Predicted arabinose efflux permease, MFS family [Modicisalibacter muralis]|uniref:Predicted arabinose efflux permease, MFS family n=1 Tax=Modicisalibacter muralis TaxID=119000 RepID=A0A1G9IHF2_9GAMM|nr:MFS transporter [Halomonas muralis]SDL24496.1 Predicted arabinose efflux permease, MFS family [Halomonas muralis]
MTETAASKQPAPTSPWAPFAHRAFALLWTATLVSNIGTWVNNAGAAWLMTTLNPSPAIVALVQTASTLPVLCFALLAGALADRVDKRHFLIVVNGFLGVVVGLLAALVAFGWMTPVLLLVFTFAIGTGAALMAPAWQAVVPSLVPTTQLSPAIALNGLGINISRAIGPALAGVLIVSVGLASPFVLNAVSFVVIIGALWIWKPPAVASSHLPPEPVFGAMLTGLRHVSRNGPLKATLVRALGFFTFASAYWALLPLVARQLPDGGAGVYGALLAAVGGGAVAGALVLPSIRERIDSNILAAFGSILTAVALALFAIAPDIAVALLASALGGLGWITSLTCFNVSAQMALPNWIRARGMAVLIMVFFGCMSAGSILWGQIAAATSIGTALLIAAAGALVAVALTWRAKLGQGEQRDLTPALAWGEPTIAETFDASPDRGPVLVTIRYRIDASDTADFLRAVYDLSGERYRNGASNWGVYQDAAEPAFWVEWFFVPSWAEHLRQHERVTRHDADIHRAARAYHRGETSPDVRHYLAPLRDSTRLRQKPESKGGAS